MARKAGERVAIPLNSVGQNAFPWFLARFVILPRFWFIVQNHFLPLVTSCLTFALIFITLCQCSYIFLAVLATVLFFSFEMARKAVERVILTSTTISLQLAHALSFGCILLRVNWPPSIHRLLTGQYEGRDVFCAIAIRCDCETALSSAVCFSLEKNEKLLMFTCAV